MKVFRGVIAIIAILVTLLRIGLYLTKSYIDEGPTITCDKDIFEIKCSDDENDLLKYVHAYDPQDGDITKNVTIEKMYFLNDNKSLVRFVAIDNDHNIKKIERTVIYTDYYGPRIKMLQSGIFVASDEISSRTWFTAEDQFNGDISSRIRLISNNFNRRKVGKYPCTVRVNNYYGSTLNVDFNLYILAKQMDYTIELKDYIIYVKKGQNKPDFMAQIDTSNSTANLNEIVVDDSALKMDSVGCYEVFYKIGDNENQKAFSRITVVVGDK